MDTATITTTAANARVHLAMVGGDGTPLCRQAKATSCKPTDRTATCRKCVKIGKQPQPEIAAALGAYQAARQAHLRLCEDTRLAFSKAQMLRSGVNRMTGDEPWYANVKAQAEAAEARHAELDAQWYPLNAAGAEALNAFRALVHGKGQRVRDYLPEFAD